MPPKSTKKEPTKEVGFSNSQRYKSASVMYTKWFTSNIEEGIKSDIVEIKAVLSDAYHFTGSNCIIPDKDPADHVVKQIETAAGGDKGSDHLFVFYYAGHGNRLGESGPLKLIGYVSI